MSGKERHDIFLLHGWSVDKNNELKWLPFMRELENLGYRPVFLGLPGLSSPLHEVWELDDYVRWLETKLKGKRDVILLGHSFGGQLAIRYAATHPRQIAHLILVASSGIRDWSLKAKVKRAGFWVAAKIGKIFFDVPIARQLLYKLARERDYLNAPPLLRRTMSLILDQEVIDEAAALHVPTLLIWGEQDRVTPTKIARRYQNLIADSDLQLIPKARHSPHYSHSHQVAKLIKQWLG